MKLRRSPTLPYLIALPASASCCDLPGRLRVARTSRLEEVVCRARWWVAPWAKWGRNGTEGGATVQSGERLLPALKRHFLTRDLRHIRLPQAPVTQARLGERPRCRGTRYGEGRRGDAGEAGQGGKGAGRGEPEGRRARRRQRQVSWTGRGCSGGCSRGHGAQHASESSSSWTVSAARTSGQERGESDAGSRMQLQRRALIRVAVPGTASRASPPAYPQMVTQPTLRSHRPSQQPTLASGDGPPLPIPGRRGNPKRARPIATTPDITSILPLM